jgi:hypothetical protein
VRDETRRVALPADARAAAEPALVVTGTLAATFFTLLPIPIFIAERRLTSAGQEALRPPTVDDILRALRTYMSGALDEAAAQRVLAQRLEMVVAPMEAAYVTVDTYMPLEHVVGLFFFLEFELSGNELVYAFEDEDEAAQLAILVRLFGRRAVKVAGPRGRLYYKVLMPSSKRGCGVVTYNLDTQLLSVKVAVRRFNESGTLEGGGDDVFPALVPAQGKQPAEYRYDLVKFQWVLASVPVDEVALATAYARRSRIDAFLGMNGTEM